MNDDAFYQVGGMRFRLRKIKDPWAVLDSVDGLEQILTDIKNLEAYKVSPGKGSASGLVSRIYATFS